jgi:hypothetical protein
MKPSSRPGVSVTMYKAEKDVEQATQVFSYIKDLLKNELPKLLALECEFIQPLAILLLYAAECFL